MKKKLIYQNKTSALILAAGNSSRMGSPKFMLRFDEKHTFLEKIVESYRQFGCKEIIVVLNTQTIEILKNSMSKIIDNNQIAINPFPEHERFLSIQTGLRALNNPQNVFIHPVDNPFVSIKVLKALLEGKENSDYQVPYYNGKGGHPILISKNVIEEICNSLETEINLKTFLNQFSKSKTETDNNEVLVNINTAEDYISFFEYFKNRQAKQPARVPSKRIYRDERLSN